ncbi:hypothetical protein ICW40_16695 [Actinotalea ferrariae]|uniref:hypothetical protein n=1 Tax=Actinotalea ferrariae TaxID=1386098 RepID=UPI001C8CA766|nr:hypothetical protein [Actinotalea ferrariae]MBX9246433.1 hypothetical protein [Actinotalea ferrariae]
MTSEPKPPWWQATRTARQGFVLSGFYAVIGLVQLYLALTDDEVSGRSVFLASIWLFLAAVYVTSSIAAHRRAVAVASR